MTKKYLLVVVAMALCLPSISLGSIYTYQVSDHPDGNQGPPPYGLRLDNIFANDGYGGVTTFSFDSGSVLAEVDTDLNTMRIFGSMFGGIDSGNNYSSEVEIQLDYTYTGLNLTNYDGTSPQLSVNHANAGSGTVEVIQEVSNASGLLGNQYGFSSKQNNSGVAFRFKDTVHRGFDGINGWGWHMLDSGNSGTQDFLFTAELIRVDGFAVVPEPGSVLIWSLVGVAMFNRTRRRNG